VYGGSILALLGGLEKEVRKAKKGLWASTCSPDYFLHGFNHRWQGDKTAQEKCREICREIRGEIEGRAGGIETTPKSLPRN